MFAPSSRWVRPLLRAQLNLSVEDEMTNPTRKSNLPLRPAMAALLLAGTAVGGAAGGVAFADSRASTNPTQLLSPESATVKQAGTHASLADMVEAVGPSVVQIQVKPEQRMQATGGQLSREEMLRRFFGHSVPEQRPQPRSSLGSGFIIDSSGLVVTNHHVVAGAETVGVQLSDGREVIGRVLGRDAKTDIAVIRIEGPEPFHAVQWGDSDRIRVGDSVFAVGSPFGLGNTVTSGIVSARSREIGAGPYDDFLQVDAAINSGNSGGPLFDASGRVVGVNTAIFSPTGGNVGIGFAIPARMVRDVAAQIAEDGNVSRGRIGLSMQDLTADTVAALRLRGAEGALIAQVDPRGSAAAAGIRSGDVIVSFGNSAIENSRDLARAVANARIGSRMPLVLIRDGRAVSLVLQVQSDADASA